MASNKIRYVTIDASVIVALVNTITAAGDHIECFGSICEALRQAETPMDLVEIEKLRLDLIRADSHKVYYVQWSGENQAHSRYLSATSARGAVQRFASTFNLPVGDAVKVEQVAGTFPCIAKVTAATSLKIKPYTP